MDVKLYFFIFDIRFVIIDVTSPACRSCLTVDARRRLCAGCTESGPVATQWACRNYASVRPATTGKDAV